MTPIRRDPAGGTPAAATSAASSSKEKIVDDKSEAESSSASSATSEDLHAEEEIEVTEPGDAPEPGDNVKYLANIRTKALHVAGAAEGEAACGYLFSAATCEMFDGLPSGGSWHLCRRPNCFKFSRGS